MIPLDDLIAAANHRPCSDHEYGLQRRCWTCRHYSFKSYTDDDNNRGKCFGIAPGRVAYTNGSDICDNFVHEGVGEKPIK